MHVEIVRDPIEILARLEALPPAEGHNEPHLDPTWLRLWWEHHGEGIEPLGMFGTSDEGERFALPLARRADRYAIWGSGLASRLVVHGPDHGQGEFVAACLRALAADDRSGVLEIRDVPEDTRTYRELRAALAERRLAGGSVALYPCPYVRLEKTHEDTLKQNVSPRRRKEFRRTAERLLELGSVEHRVLDGQAAADEFPRFADLHAARFRGRWNRAMAPDAAAFLRAVAAADDGPARLSVLLVDGVAASYLLGFVGGNRFVDYIPAFDPSLESYDAGHAHLYHLTQWLVAQGFAVLDFSKGDAVYKRKWASAESWNHVVYLPVSRGFRSRAVCERALLVERALALGRRHGANAAFKRALGRSTHGASRPADVRSPAAVPEPAALRPLRYASLSSVALPIRARAIELRRARQEPIDWGLAPEGAYLADASRSWTALVMPPRARP